MKSIKKCFILVVFVISLSSITLTTYATEVQQSIGLATTTTNAVFYSTPDLNTAPVAVFAPGLTFFSKGTTANTFYNVDIGGTIYYTPLNALTIRSEKEAIDYATERTNAINLIYAEINLLRTGLGLGALEVDNTLMAIAQARADDMASLQYLSHYKDGKLQFVEVGNAFKLGKKVSTGENIARTTVNVDIGDRFMALWISSNGHYLNMIDNSWEKVGIGIAQDTKGRFYGVQIFSD